MTLSPPSPYIFGPNLFANELGFSYDLFLPIWANDPISALFFFGWLSSANFANLVRGFLPTGRDCIAAALARVGWSYQCDPILRQN